MLFCPDLKVSRYIRRTSLHTCDNAISTSGLQFRPKHNKALSLSISSK